MKVGSVYHNFHIEVLSVAIKECYNIQIIFESDLKTVYECYVSDLEEGEKTLLLHEGEGKLSRVRSRLIYKDFPGVRPCTGRDSTLARKRIGLVL